MSLRVVRHLRLTRNAVAVLALSVSACGQVDDGHPEAGVGASSGAGQAGSASSSAGASGARPVDFAAAIRCVRSDTVPAKDEGFFEVGDYSVIDSATELEWQKELGPGFEQNQAREYCDSLSIGQKSDWRLPSMQELATLIIENNLPALDVRAFPGDETQLQNWVWATETFAMKYGGQLRFADGQLVLAPVYAISATRCVRDR